MAAAAAAKPEIYTHESPFPVYAVAWSVSGLRTVIYRRSSSAYCALACA